jgi:hypothetical protein
VHQATSEPHRAATLGLHMEAAHGKLRERNSRQGRTGGCMRNCGLADDSGYKSFGFRCANMRSDAAFFGYEKNLKRFVIFSQG